MKNQERAQKVQELANDFRSVSGLAGAVAKLDEAAAEIVNVPDASGSDNKDKDAQQRMLQQVAVIRRMEAPSPAAQSQAEGVFKKIEEGKLGEAADAYQDAEDARSGDGPYASAMRGLWFSELSAYVGSDTFVGSSDLKIDFEGQ